MVRRFMRRSVVAPVVVATACALGCPLGCALAAATAIAQEPPSESIESSADATGAFDWTFHLDASVGAFGFMNSLFTDPRPGVPSGDLGDHWLEGSVAPGVTGTWTGKGSWQLYGTVTAVGVATHRPAPPRADETPSSLDVDDLALGWRSGKLLEGLGENAVEVIAGRAPYQLGHGFLLWDGAADGGSRGGYWTNRRDAFERAAIARLTTGRHKVEAFDLDYDDLPESESGSELWGLNYELTLAGDTTLGATYMAWSADPASAPQRDGLEVWDFRAYTTPFPAVEALSFELELALERNGDALDSHAWTAGAAYAIDAAWSPTVSYRYAFFEGDDPGDARNQAFDSLLAGFYDWGTWWQGEIAGEYLLANSNLVSHQLGLRAAPNDAIETGLLLYDFHLDRPMALGVVSDRLAREIDGFADWSLDDHVKLSFVAAWADPGQAVREAFGRTEQFVYGMVFVAYHY